MPQPQPQPEKPAPSCQCDPNASQEITDAQLKIIADILFERIKSNPEPFRAKAESIDVDKLAKEVIKRLPDQEFIIIDDKDGDGFAVSDDGEVFNLRGRASENSGTEVFRQKKPLGEPIKIVVKGILKAT